MANVEMTQQERAEFEAFKAAKARKEAEAKKKADREAYKALVDETINKAMPDLEDISREIAVKKSAVMEQFGEALKMKEDLYGVKNDQRSHTFTNSEVTKRITLGKYVLDNYSDTVNEGISIVKEYIESLAKDDESRALVKAVLRLMSRDNAGNLKASRVLQLRKMAEESGNERFIEGVKIIEDSYQPICSKQYVRAEIKDVKTGAWKQLALGMTEA